MKLQIKNGFSILAVILVIVTVIVAIGVWALSGQNNSSSSNNTNGVLASAIITDGLKYKSIYDTYIINGIAPTGNSSTNSVIFKPNVSDARNMLDPKNGVTWEQLSSKALVSGASFPQGYWAFNKNMLSVANLGTAFFDQAFIVTGLSDNVCKAINQSLYGNSTIPVFTDNTGYTINDDITTSDAITYDYINMIYLGSISGWKNGCVNHNGNPVENFYFQVVRVS